MQNAKCQHCLTVAVSTTVLSNEYVEIALRESRESVYWLRLCIALGLAPRRDIDELRNEGDQIAF